VFQEMRTWDKNKKLICVDKHHGKTPQSMLYIYSHAYHVQNIIQSNLVNLHTSRDELQISLFWNIWKKKNTRNIFFICLPK